MGTKNLTKDLNCSELLSDAVEAVLALQDEGIAISDEYKQAVIEQFCRENPTYSLPLNQEESFNLIMQELE
jgi:hypothetical protein